MKGIYHDDGSVEIIYTEDEAQRVAECREQIKEMIGRVYDPDDLEELCDIIGDYLEDLGL